MIAALPMYDWLHTCEANDTLWQHWRDALQAKGVTVPHHLNRQLSARAVVEHPELMVTQTCGLPYVLFQHKTCRLVATPCYAAAGCAESSYCSVLVARGDDARERLHDFRDRTIAINEWHSHSGHTALVAALRARQTALPFFRQARLTGSHRKSMAAVATGHADLAAIDCITWAHAVNSKLGTVDQLRVIGMTPPAPGLPLIAPRAYTDSQVNLLRSALVEVLADPQLRPTLATLLLAKVEILSDHDYAPLRTLWQYAEQHPIAQAVHGPKATETIHEPA